MWQDFYVEGRPFSKVAKYENDFTSFVADEWTITEVDVGTGNTTQTLADLRGGVLVLTSAANEDDGNNLQLGGSSDDETTGESFAPEAGKNLWFEARVRVDEATQQDFFVGLHVQDTTIIAGRGSDYIGFRKDDGDALLDVEAAASSQASSQTGVATIAANTYYVLGFKVTGTEKIEYYVDGRLVATVTSGIPTGLMKLSLAQLSGEAVAHSLSIDYVVVAQDR